MPNATSGTKIAMNDAQGQASNLLILLMATALAGAGTLSWALTQTSFFKSKSASSLAVKNTVSEGIMTNEPVRTASKVVIPAINPVRSIEPIEFNQQETVATLPASLADKKVKPDNTELTELVNTDTQLPESLITEPDLVQPETITPPALTDTAEIVEITADSSPTEPATSDAPQEETTSVPDTVIAEKPDTNTVTEQTAPTEDSTTEQTTGTEEQAAETLLSQSKPQEQTEVTGTGSAKDQPETVSAPAETTTPETSQEQTEQTAAEPGSETDIKTDSETATTENIQNQDSKPHQKSGWIYAGQYKDRKWIKCSLELPADQLPEAGNVYTLVWETNVRLAPPGKRKPEGSNLAKNVDYLAENKKVKVVKVKNSGKTGHIWLKINY